MAGPDPTVLLRADMDALPLTEDTGLPTQLRGRRGDARLRPRHPCRDARWAPPACSPTAGPSSTGASCSCSSPARRASRRPLMLDEGLLELRRGRSFGQPVTGAFALHISSDVPAGTIHFAARAADGRRPTSCRSTSAGAGGHASAAPPALDPIPVACRDRPRPPDVGHPPRRRLRSGRVTIAHLGGGDDDEHHSRDGQFLGARSGPCLGAAPEASSTTGSDGWPGGIAEPTGRRRDRARCSATRSR